MAIYDDILDAAGNNHQAAGNLHERLWVGLLKREDPRFHNIRLTNGDGGIDGLLLKDPVLGEVCVFQAKFFKEIASDKHKRSIIDSFYRALLNDFKIVEWCLLVPISLSHKEINWLLNGSLKKEAAKKLGKEKEEKIRTCAITYKIEPHLLDLCSRNIDIPSELLPKSSMAMLKDLSDARNKSDFLQREIADRLQILNRDQIRRRQIEVKKAVSTLNILHHGWADHAGMLDLVWRTKGNDQKVEEIARELEDFSQRRADQAIAAEEVVPGISMRVVQIYKNTRILVSHAVQCQYAKDESLRHNMWTMVKNLKDEIRDLQHDIGAIIYAASQDNNLDSASPDFQP